MLDYYYQVASSIASEADYTKNHVQDALFPCSIRSRRHNLRGQRLLSSRHDPNAPSKQPNHGTRSRIRSRALGSGNMSPSTVKFLGLLAPSGNLSSYRRSRVARISFISLTA